MAEIDFSQVNAPPEILELLQKQSEDLKTLERERAPRSSRGLGKDGLLAALQDSLEETAKNGKPKVVGRNKAFVDLFKEGFVYESGEKITPKELQESFALLLETCPGVTVDRKKLKMSPVFGQWNLRVYNRPEVGLLVKGGDSDTDGS